MTEPMVMQAAVLIAAVWENKARATGKTFWKVVTDAGDTFTAFGRDLIAPFIEGVQPATVNNSIVWNRRPPLNAVVFFEVRDKGKVLVPKPDQAVPYAEPPAATQTVPVPTAYAPPATQKPPYRPYGGQKSGGSGWKPEDKRPGLVTMNEAYAKDIVTAIIGNSDDLKAQDPDAVATWAGAKVTLLSKAFLDYALAELRGLGFNPEEAAK